MLTSVKLQLGWVWVVKCEAIGFIEFTFLFYKGNKALTQFILQCGGRSVLLLPWDNTKSHSRYSEEVNQNLEIHLLCLKFSLSLALDTTLTKDKYDFQYWLKGVNEGYKPFCDGECLLEHSWTVICVADAPEMHTSHKKQGICQRPCTESLH